MRSWHTDRTGGSFRGTVETLLVLPLLLLLAWGCSLLGLTLIRESRAQQAVWVYTMARAHAVSSESDAREMTERTAGLRSRSIRVQSIPDCLRWQDLAAQGVRSLPAGFVAALRLNCPLRHRFSMTDSFPESLRNLLEAAGFGRSGGGMPLNRWRRELETRTPGDDFHGSRIVRQALWQEAMARAGFGTLPLQLLAVPELSSVIGVDLGGPAKEVLRKWKEGLLGGLP